MNAKRLFIGLGVSLLIVGTSFNVYDAFNEYGVLENMLHPRVKAQTGINGSTTHITVGKRTKQIVECRIKSSSSSSSNNSTTTSSGGSWGGSIGGSWGGIGAEVSGSTTSGNSTSSSQGGSSDAEVIKIFWANQYSCEPENGYENVKCTEYDPCPSVHKNQ